VVAPVVARIGNDRVIAGLRMRQKPTAAVIGIDMNFGIREERLHHGVLRNQLKVSGIDFHGIERFHLRMVRQNLSPGARSETYDQDSFGGGTKGAERVTALSLGFWGRRLPAFRSQSGART